MLLLYSIAVGLIAGRLLGGRLRNLERIRFVWWQLALAGLFVQLLLFADPIQERVGAEGPVIYVFSTLMVMAALLRNLRLPGLAVIAVGAMLNLIPVVLNGGFMPSSPEAWLELTGVAALPVSHYSNAVLDRPRHALPVPGRHLRLPATTPHGDRLLVRRCRHRPRCRGVPGVLHAAARTRCWVTADDHAASGSALMEARVHETTSALRHLAVAVDADCGAHLFVDRGDGVLESVASVRDGQPIPPGAADAGPGGEEPGLLRRFLPSSLGGSPGAVARLTLPDERGGLLVLERKRDEPFTDEDLALARIQARQLVGHVATRLGPRPIAWSAQLEAVQSVAAQLTRLTSVEEVSAALCSQTQRVVGFDNARVYVLSQDGRTLEPVAFRPHAREYDGESAAGLRVTVGEGITGWVAATGQQLIIHDAAHDPRAVHVPGSVELEEESMLLAPLRSEGRVIGVVVLSRLGLSRFSDDELRLLGVLADQAAIAIENARLLTERDRHVAELAALLDISQAGGGATDERELAEVLAGKLRDAAHMDICLISSWDEETGALSAIGASGRPLDAPARDVAVHRALRRVLINDEPLLLDVSVDDLEPAEMERLRALGGEVVLLLPLTTAGHVVGLVEFVSRVGGRTFLDSEMALLRTMTNQAAAALENASLVRQLRDAAETDLVTGVYSHRHLQDRVRQETARAARSHASLSVLMVDLDDFKLVNDQHGHQAGDRVLRAIAGALRAAVRTSDVVARYGGDEFVVLMPDTDADEAARVAQRAATAVAELGHPMADGSEVHISCSVGLALHPRDGRSGKALLRAADAAMYSHKRSRSGAARRARRSTVPETMINGTEPRVPA